MHCHLQVETKFRLPRHTWFQIKDVIYMLSGSVEKKRDREQSTIVDLSFRNVRNAKRFKSYLESFNLDYKYKETYIDNIPFME